jgi:hypothetical protein
LREDILAVDASHRRRRRAGVRSATGEHGEAGVETG